MWKTTGLAAAVLILWAVGCASTAATTAEEFIKKHAKAYYLKDAGAVAGMTLCAEDLAQTMLPDSIKEELNDSRRDSLKAEVKRQMKDRGDMWSRAWEDTKYMGEKDHGSYVHVEVKVGYAYSSIVLVRVGKTLKIAPNPSSFE